MILEIDFSGNTKVYNRSIRDTLKCFLKMNCLRNLILELSRRETHHLGGPIPERAEKTYQLYQRSKKDLEETKAIAQKTFLTMKNLSLVEYYFDPIIVEISD